MVQWLRLHAANAGGAGSIPGWGTRIPHAVRHGQRIKQQQQQQIYIYGTNWEEIFVTYIINIKKKKILLLGPISNY